MKTHLLLLVILLSSPVLGVEVPLGVDGHVYALDGTTPVPDAVVLQFTNTGTGDVFVTNPGRGAPGRYSVALNWAKGSTVLIRASNPTDHVERTITLTGILHGVDLYLNMSLPPLPPNITSTPPTTATQGVLYSYVPTAFDWNNDVVVFSLAEHPAGMRVLQGTVVWTPGNTDPGTHNIVLVASDGVLNTTQEFSIVVVDVNDPPLLEDISERTRAPSVQLQLGAIDPDGDSLSYSLVSGPGTVTPDGLFTYQFTRPRVITSVVRVSDGELEDTGDVTVSYTRRGRRGGGGGTIPPRTVEPSPEPPRPLPIPARVRELSRAPAGVPSLGQLTYRYFLLPEGVNDQSFSVARAWLEENGLAAEDVRLFSYTDSWQEVIATDITLLSGNVVVQADGERGRIFAIAADKIPEDLSLDEIVISEPSIIVGTVVDTTGSPVRAGTKIVVEDRTSGAMTTTETGTGPAPNVFNIVLNNVRGHELTVTVPGRKGSLTLTADSLNTVTIEVTQPTFSITGLVTLGKTTTGLAGLLLFIVLGAIIYLVTRVRSWRKL